MNICSSSIYQLSNKISEIIKESDVIDGISKLEESIYSINFHRGNHFIVLAKSIDNIEYLFIHTSAAEFKKQFNGLYPVAKNWFMDDVKVDCVGNRYLRYLIGVKAELFCKIAKHLVNFNEVRHDFFAEVLIGKNAKINSSSHHHHYYMPSNNSVIIGSFLSQPNDLVPIFTREGKPIIKFKVLPSSNSFIINGRSVCLIPHGWGKTCNIAPNINIDIKNKIFSLNGINHYIDGSSSLRAHPDLSIRDYEYVPNVGYPIFEKELKKFCNGQVVDYFYQIFSYNKKGYIRWTT